MADLEVWKPSWIIPVQHPPDPHGSKKLCLFFPGYDGKFSFDFDSQWSTVFLDSVEPSADLSSMPSLGAMLNMPLIDAWRFWVIGGSFFFCDGGEKRGLSLVGWGWLGSIRSNTSCEHRWTTSQSMVHALSKRSCCYSCRLGLPRVMPSHLLETTNIWNSVDNIIPTLVLSQVQISCSLGCTC